MTMPGTEKETIAKEDLEAAELEKKERGEKPADPMLAGTIAGRAPSAMVGDAEGHEATASPGADADRALAEDRDKQG